MIPPELVIFVGIIAGTVTVSVVVVLIAVGLGSLVGSFIEGFS
jgi:hypothetical protein